jgi:lysozyme
MTSQAKKYLVIGIVALILLSSTMAIGAKAEELIKKFEADDINKYLDAYIDPVGIPTIGYGSTYNYDAKRKVQLGDSITQAKAVEWLRKITKAIVPQIKALVKVPINQNQLDSLTSFVYNVGIGNFKNSTLLRLLNSGAPKTEVAAQFDRWNKGTVNGQKVVLPGLTRRRNEEKALFLA